MAESKANRKCEESEEYRIVDDDAPVSKMNILTLHRIATEHPEKVLEALGIHEGTYDLGRIGKEEGVMLHSAILGYRGKSPTRSELKTIESRAHAYNVPSILTPSSIRRTFKDRPDIAVIMTVNGILESFKAIREASDIPLLDHGEGWYLISEEEKMVMRSMMEYRNKVFTTIDVERPSEQEVDSWIHLFLDILARMYTIANGEYIGGN